MTRRGAADGARWQPPPPGALSAERSGRTTAECTGHPDGRPAPPLVRRPGGWDRASAVFSLLHPGPSAATVLVAAGYMVLLARGRPPLPALAWLVAMVSLQQAAISLHNDWCDRELDARAKPWRAIPSGAVAPVCVRALAWALAAAAAAAAMPLGWDEVALAIAGTAAGLTYNAWLKRTPWSWLPFAAAFPLLPLFGAAALDRWPPAWWTLFAGGLPVALAIHLADALPDLESDATSGIRGLAHVLGRRAARRASLVALGAAAGLCAAFGFLVVSGWALSGAAAGLAGLLAGTYWPRAHRVAVTAGGAAAALGLVAALAHAAA